MALRLSWWAERNLWRIGEKVAGRHFTNLRWMFRNVADSIETWRRIVLVLVVAGSAGVAAELGLLGHFEDWTQRIPLLVLGGGAVAAVWAGLRPSRLSLRFLQGLMAAFAVSGVLGVYFHFRSNFEFEMEMLMETLPAGAAEPPAASLEVVVASLQGALPALAPLAMLQLGLLGLLASWRHPVLSTRGAALQAGATDSQRDSPIQSKGLQQ